MHAMQLEELTAAPLLPGVLILFSNYLLLATLAFVITQFVSVSKL